MKLYEICTNCSSRMTTKEIQANGHLSCCPERKLVLMSIGDREDEDREFLLKMSEDPAKFEWALRLVAQRRNRITGETQ